MLNHVQLNGNIGKVICIKNVNPKRVKLIDLTGFTVHQEASEASGGQVHSDREYNRSV